MNVMKRKIISIILCISMFASLCLTATATDLTLPEGNVLVTSSDDAGIMPLEVNYSSTQTVVYSYVNLRAGPATSYNSFGLIYYGATVKTYKRTDNKDSSGYYWYLVQVTSGGGSLNNYYGYVIGASIGLP